MCTSSETLKLAFSINLTFIHEVRQEAIYIHA